MHAQKHSLSQQVSHFCRSTFGLRYMEGTSLSSTRVLLLFLAMLTMSSVAMAGSKTHTQHAPCFFIFGDSLVDNGNNNHIPTLARANYLPYGIDFPLGVSGRFTNGRTIVDILAQLLGFREFVPSFASARREQVVRGLNFASGASGIRVETGTNLGLHYPLYKQVEHFRSAVEIMKSVFKGNTTKLATHLSRCIYYAGMGSNDYLNNYFMPLFYPTSYVYDPNVFAGLLLQDYSQQLRELYNLGARKVAVFGLGQIGCIPYELARYNNRNYDPNGDPCNEEINEAIAIFNAGLLRMVTRFNSALRGAKFVYVNTYDSSKDLAANALSYGFSEVDKGCCGVGRNNGQITCLPRQTPCGDRSKYLFWDAFHPTEAANLIYAMKAYNSTSTTEVYPMNLRQLAAA